MTTLGLQPNVLCANDAVDKSSQNSMAVILKGISDTFVQVTKASENLVLWLRDADSFSIMIFKHRAFIEMRLISRKLL